MTNYSFKQSDNMKLSLATISDNLAYLVHNIHSSYFNPCVKVKSWTCQYFSLSHKTLSTSSSSLTKTCSISCTRKYSVYICGRLTNI